MNGEMFPFREKREPRYRVLDVTPELMMNVLLSPQRHACEVRSLVIEGLPNGVEIDAVFWSDECRCFRFRLWHESFDLVSLAEMIPLILPTVRVDVIRLSKEEADR